VDWIQLTQDVVQWQAFVYNVMKIRVTQRRRISRSAEAISCQEGHSSMESVN